MACRLESREGIEYMTACHGRATLESARMRESLGLDTNHEPSVAPFAAPSCVYRDSQVFHQTHMIIEKIESEDSVLNIILLIGESSCYYYFLVRS